MSEEKAMAQELLALEQAGGMIRVDLGPEEAFALIALLQLACRHPGCLGKPREVAESVGRFVQAAFARHSELLDRFLERGWHEVLDVHARPWPTTAVRAGGAEGPGARS